MHERPRDVKRTCAACALLALAAAAACGGASEPQPVAGQVRLAFVGDTNGYNIADDPLLEGRDLLAGVDKVLDDVDLFVFNHEGTLIEPADAPSRCRTYETQSTFAGSPAFANRLTVRTRALATMANNHAMDCGPEGLAQTRQALDEAGILTVGAGSSLDEACRPVELAINGVDIAFFAYFVQDLRGVLGEVVATAGRPGVATMEGCGAEAAVKAVAPRTVVVVSLHTHVGPSWTYDTAPEFVSAVRRLLESGADVVVAHGPHFPQGVLAEGDGLAFLSLGNFMFRPGYVMEPEAHQSLLAVLGLGEAGVTEARLYPVEVTQEGLPVLAQGPTSQEILALVGELSKEYGVTIAAEDGFGLVTRRVASERNTSGLPPPSGR